MHIGNGYILTAAHVVVDGEQPPRVAKDVKLKTLAGEQLDVEVLWSNEAMTLR